MGAAVFSPVILGLWPIAGITSVDVQEDHSLATLRRALDVGVTTFDTAFSYGYDGESDRLLGESIRGVRDRIQVIGKVGQRWTADRVRVTDGSMKTLVRDAETSLKRIGIDHFDLLMLHGPDPQVDVRVSAEALAMLQLQGKASAVGACNVNEQQIRAFAEVIPATAVQVPLNCLQQSSLENFIPWCSQRGTAVLVYWVLMKGILAGQIRSDHLFDSRDSRPSYPIYQGEMRARTHRLLDRLQVLAREYECSVAQLSVGWALSQPGVTSVLVGAKRPGQIEETAGSRPLSPELLAAIDEAILSSRERA